MLALLKLFASPKAILAVVAALVLALTHFTAYRAGRAMVAADWAQEKARRMAEQVVERDKALAAQLELQGRLSDVDRKLQAAKADRLAADGRAAERLRLLEAARAAADAERGEAPAASGGADDPDRVIASECPAALATLDRAYRSVAEKARGLQGYADQLCVNRP